LTEPDTGGATSTEVIPATITVGQGDEPPATFEVTNTFDVGTVAVSKVLEGAAADYAAGPFTVELACTFQGEPIDLDQDAQQVLSVEDGLTGAWDGLPVGAECSLTETDAGGATASQIVPDAVVVTPDDGETAGFTVTNTFDAGPVEVTKVLDGEGAAEAVGPFTMELACSFQGAPIDLGADAVRTLSPEDGLTGEWTGLPLGAECVLTETD